MSQRQSLACGGLPLNGGEAFKSRRWTTETRARYFILVGAIGERRESPCADGANVIRVGNCLSKTWTWASVQDCLQGLSGLHLEIGLSIQQQVIPASVVPATHADCGAPIPDANTAIRICMKVFKRIATGEPLQHREVISSLESADTEISPKGQRLHMPFYCS
jgi:hypothetical protein